MAVACVGRFNVVIVYMSSLLRGSSVRIPSSRGDDIRRPPTRSDIVDIPLTHDGVVNMSLIRDGSVAIPLTRGGRYANVTCRQWAWQDTRRQQIRR